uniref:Uncharacterized protein n=1 Tax=Lactuca sativa TaxID=4236 RepID=A0A9R1XGV4_LACSA|nr:hypothetical protein LSAT_V11C400168480 [Lactuca sativa]
MILVFIRHYFSLLLKVPSDFTSIRIFQFEALGIEGLFQFLMVAMLENSPGLEHLCIEEVISLFVSFDMSYSMFSKLCITFSSISGFVMWETLAGLSQNLSPVVYIRTSEP